MLTALTSVRGGAGVTTATLALAGGWPSGVLIAECDPFGGTIAHGLLRGEHTTSGRSLYAAVMSARRRAGSAAADGGRAALAEELSRHVLAPDGDGRRLWLPGFTNLGQGPSLGNADWSRLADVLVSLAETASPTDVLADCGRLHAASPVWPLVERAARVLVVARPELTHAAAVLAAVPLLVARLVGDSAAPPPPSLGVLLCGDGHVSAKEFARAVGLPVVGELPQDAGTAAALTGEKSPGGGRGRARLPRAAAQVAADLSRPPQHWATVSAQLLADTSGNENSRDGEVPADAAPLPAAPSAAPLTEGAASAASARLRRTGEVSPAPRQDRPEAEPATTEPASGDAKTRPTQRRSPTVWPAPPPLPDPTEDTSGANAEPAADVVEDAHQPVPSRPVMGAPR